MKKVLFITNILLLVLISNSFAQQADTAQIDPKAATHYNNAMLAMKNQKFEEALVQLDSSLIYAKEARTYFFKGQALLKLQKYQDAISIYNEALKINPKYDLAQNALANTQIIIKDYDNAIASYEKLLQITQNEELKKGAVESIEFAKSTKAIEFFNKGNELSKAGKFDDAIVSYDQALAINNKDAKTYYQKGLTLAKMNKDDEAAATLKKAVEVDNTFDLAYIALAGLDTKKNAYDDAVKDYEKVLEISKNDNLKAAAKDGIARTYLTAGSVAYKDKKYDKSIEYLKKSVEKSSTDNAYLGLAKSYIEKKQYDVALKSLDSTTVYKKVVTDGAIAYWRGMVYLNKGDNAKAKEFFKVGLADAVYKKACQSQLDYIAAKEKGAKPKK